MTRQSHHTPQLRYPIDPVAFFLAMIAGPLLVALLGFPIFLIPVFALVIGGLPYLIIGIPVMMYVLRHNDARPALFAGSAFLTILALGAICGVTILFADLQIRKEELGIVNFYAFFSAIFAPLWGATSGWLYTCWRREIYSHPVTL